MGGATAAQDLWLQPCLASAGAEITWGFPTEMESVLGRRVAVTKVRELVCWLAQPSFLLTLMTSKDVLPHAFPLQDQKRMEKISKRVNAIEEVNNNVKLLTEMVTNYSKGETTESNEDLMKVRRGYPNVCPGLSRDLFLLCSSCLFFTLSEHPAAHLSAHLILSPRSCISAVSA